MKFLEKMKSWVGEITEVALLLITLGVSAEVLFGSEVPLFSGIAGNLIRLIGTLGQEGLVGLIALGIIIFLFQRSKAIERPQPQQHQQYNPQI